MGTIRIGAVRFKTYPNDYLPPHVHGVCGGIEVVVDLLENGLTALSMRTRNIKPRNAKLSDVRTVLDTAAQNYASLNTLWENAPCAKVRRTIRWPSL